MLKSYNIKDYYKLIKYIRIINNAKRQRSEDSIQGDNV